MLLSSVYLIDQESHSPHHKWGEEDSSLEKFEEKEGNRGPGESPRVRNEKKDQLPVVCPDASRDLHSEEQVVAFFSLSCSFKWSSFLEC